MNTRHLSTAQYEKWNEKLHKMINNKIICNTIDYRESIERIEHSITKDFCTPLRVIYNYPGKTTIVYWKDGSKTIVTCNNDDFDEEVGFAMALTKKVFNGRATYQKIIEEKALRQVENYKKSDNNNKGLCDLNSDLCQCSENEEK